MNRVITEWDYIDTHCHIEQDDFSNDRQEVISRAMNSMIAIITSAIRSDTWKTTLSLSESHDSVFTSIGLDPTNYEKYKEAIYYIRDHAKLIVAIGEVGLDHYIIRDHTQREMQNFVFHEFITLSKE